MKTKIDWIDAEDVAKAVLGLHEDASSDDVENAVHERLDISFDSFHQVLALLAPLTPPAKAALSGKLYCGFMRDGVWLARVDAGPEHTQ